MSSTRNYLISCARIVVVVKLKADIFATFIGGNLIAKVAWLIRILAATIRQARRVRVSAIIAVFVESAA